ncbi:MMPL family transporter [Actinomadura alba]|uniref:MMPL family transporter n=1 Tax=Actinomadura alba TaxID=406431 RepID=A0ABR7LR37_9ACTN|nr:MMPL family transporter [Actinomadura alba]MBC6467300.1 MMPL family transporter [Actinomadura alba]
MFTRLANLVIRRPRAILVLALLFLAATAGLGVSAFGKLQTGGFADPSADSTRVEEMLDDWPGGTADLVFLIDAGPNTVSDPAVSASGRELTRELTRDSELVRVTSWFDTSSPALRSADGRYALVLADTVAGDDVVPELRDHYAGRRGPVTVTIGGPEAVSLDITDQVGKDLAVAESIAVPLILLLLLVAFRSLVAALLPLMIGVLAVFATFAELAVLGSLTQVSIFAINLTTALGLGLAVDYAMLIVSRYREGLGSGLEPADAVRRCLATAGRTVAFSALTVATALTVLLLFPLYFLRSFAYAGIGVVLAAMLAAVVVLPAALVVLGRRIERGRIPSLRPTSAESTFWGRVAATVLRRPALTAAPVLAVLVLAASPLLGSHFATPDDRVLRVSADARAVGDVLRDDFPGNDAAAMQVVLMGTPDKSAVSDYARKLSRLDGVTQVRSTAGSYADGRAATGPAPTDPEHEGAERLVVGTSLGAETSDGQDLVREVRAIAPPTGTTSYVGGPAAELADSKAAVGSRLPAALGLVAVLTFALLFLFTGTVVQPLRALLLNAVSLSATLGLMVLVFQHGWFDDVLGHTARPLDIAMLVLLVCITFGLSMDYEVFVVSRIIEEHEAGADLATSVTRGLSGTGRIVTTAAALLAVNFFAFTTSGVTFIQMFGLGSGLAILIDATLVRAVLVPAAMRVTGQYSWWAPRFLQRVHRRIGLREAT